MAYRIAPIDFERFGPFGDDDEPFCLLLFPWAAFHRLGPPNDEGLGAHPLAAAGLKWYSVHEIVNSSFVASSSGRWCHRIMRGDISLLPFRTARSNALRRTAFWAGCTVRMTSPAGRPLLGSIRRDRVLDGRTGVVQHDEGSLEITVRIWVNGTLRFLSDRTITKRHISLFVIRNGAGLRNLQQRRLLVSVPSYETLAVVAGLLTVVPLRTGALPKGNLVVSGRFRLGVE